MAYPINIKLNNLEGVTVKVESVGSPFYLAKDSTGNLARFTCEWVDYTKKDGTQTKIPKYYKIVRNEDKSETAKLLDAGDDADFDTKRAFQDQLRKEVFTVQNKKFTIVGTADKKFSAQKKDPTAKAFEGNYVRFDIGAIGLQNLLETVVAESKLPAKKASANGKEYRPFGWEEDFVDNLPSTFVKGVKVGEYINLAKGEAFEPAKAERKTDVKEATSAGGTSAPLPF